MSMVSPLALMARGLATGSLDKTVKLWDAETGKELLTLPTEANQVLSVVFSPDGTRWRLTLPLVQRRCGMP